MDWFNEIFGNALEQLYLGVEKIYLLADNINSIQFTEYDYLYQFIGLIRYIAGEPLFIAIALFFDICVGFVCYKIFKRIVSVITSIVTNKKGKFIIP